MISDSILLTITRITAAKYLKNDAEMSDDNKNGSALNYKLYANNICIKYIYWSSS